MRRLLAILLLLPLSALAQTTYYAAGTTAQGFNPAGNDSNNGTSAATPRTAQWCFGNLSPGDTCIYASGNYEGLDFEPTVSGTSGNEILHDCADKHTCSFDRWLIVGVSYIEVRRLRSETDYYDSTKSFTNPRVRIDEASRITLTSVFLRGEPQICADTNVGPGCPSGDPDRRYNDLLDIQSNSNRIEIRSDDTYGETRILNASHSLLEINDNGGGDCDENERYYWIHGTPDNPLIFSSLYHHTLTLRGVCDTLIEHVDFQQSGTGRSDLVQPQNSSTEDQSGGTLHGADFTRMIVRFATGSYGGSGTNENNNGSMIEIGLFGGNTLNTVTDVCLAHWSLWRPWGTAGTVSEVNQITAVDDIVMLNMAIDEGWYLDQSEGSVVADGESNGYVFRRSGGGAVTDVFLDGIVFNLTPSVGGSGFLYDDRGIQTNLNAADCPATVDGVECGSNIVNDTDDLFNDPNNRDFTAADTAALNGQAVPIAVTTNSGTGSTINVTRPYCFADNFDGMRPSGDVLDINGDTCTVTSVGSASITCNESITWSSGESIRYTIGGTVMDDIGAIEAAASPGEPPPPGPGSNIEKHL